MKTKLSIALLLVSFTSLAMQGEDPRGIYIETKTLTTEEKMGYPPCDSNTDMSKIAFRTAKEMGFCVGSDESLCSFLGINRYHTTKLRGYTWGEKKWPVYEKYVSCTGRIRARRTHVADEIKKLVQKTKFKINQADAHFEAQLDELSSAYSSLSGDEQNLLRDYAKIEISLRQDHGIFVQDADLKVTRKAKASYSIVIEYDHNAYEGELVSADLLLDLLKIIAVEAETKSRSQPTSD